MNCKFCKKEVDEKEVQRVYGKYFSDYGCCSPQCYTKILIGEKPENNEKENKNEV